MKKLTVITRPGIKAVRSEDYNYNFDLTNGKFQRWGKTREDDPQKGPPEILDIEVTTICKGPGGKPCSFCYKSNSPVGKNMSLETFKKIFNKLPRTITQIAIGGDAQATANPELFDMMRYCRNNDYNIVIPNITVADISDSTADQLSELCGAVAISRYSDKSLCYDSVKKLVDRGMDQVNIHMMICQESYQQCIETIEDYSTDPRLKGMNSIVFLSLKQKGRGVKFHNLPQEEFTHLIQLGLKNNVRMGFDSCSAHKFLLAIADRPDLKYLEEMVEPCESSLFSTYIDVNGKYYPCSFAPDSDIAGNGIDVIEADNFMMDVWHHPSTEKFRNQLLCGGRKCPLFDIGDMK
jgi:MoaA/NifB/PqqE/SkfB family radical SAM enzyme